MYTMELNEDGEWPAWDILDPGGDVILTGLSEAEASGLLSHLNRG